MRVIVGEVFDVAVDLREGSPTFGKHFGVKLTAENKKQFFIPKGFAHGFLALRDNSTVMYQCDGAYDKDSDTGVLFCDKDIAVKWPVDVSDMIIGQRDSTLMTFREFDSKYTEGLQI